MCIVVGLVRSEGWYANKMKKAEITILPARETTRPGLQAGTSWLERKGYIRGSVARDSHLGF